MRDFRITGVDIEHIGPFEKLHIDFPDKQDAEKAEIHIFTGENGTGKSTLLECLTSFGSNDFLKKVTDYERARIIIKEPEFLFSRKGKHQDFFREPSENPNPNSFLGKQAQLYAFNITGGIFSTLICAYSGYRKFESFKINSIQEINASPIENVLNFKTSSNTQILLQWVANTKAREALAFRRNDFDAVKKYENVINKIEYTISEITGWEIKFQLVEDPLKVITVVNEVPLDVDVLPDGLKSIISWIADLLMRIDRIKWIDKRDSFDKNLIVFLDEIDIHMHPAWQRRILPVIQKLFKNSQIFVSTHSPFVINSVDGAWIYKLKKEGKNSVLDGEPVLSEDGKSYRLILDEIFGINEDFGIEVEEDLKKFYAFKDRILRDELLMTNNDFNILANALAKQSTELNTIIGMELRQLNRIKGVAVTS
jgi:hypothetical protein